MRKMILLLLLYVLCVACAAKVYTITLPQNVGTKSYALWYTYQDTTIPLLAGFEQNAEEAHLGLIFLQGKRLAKCTYQKNVLTCTLDSALQNTAMQTMADTSARLIAYILENRNALPKGWEKVSQEGTKHLFKESQGDSYVRIEES